MNLFFYLQNFILNYSFIVILSDHSDQTTHCTTRVTTYTCYMFAATTLGLIARILNSVFFFKISKLFSNFNEVQTYSLMMIC